MVDYINDPAINEDRHPPGVLISGYFTEPFGYGTYRPNGTRDWLITLTLSGRGEYKLRNETFPCGEGDIVLLPPGTPHHYYTPPESCWEFVWAHFVPESRWLEWLRIPADEYGMIRISLGGTSATYERTAGAFRRLIRESRHTGRYGELLSLNALEEVLLHMTQFAAKESHADPRIDDTLTFLIDHLHLPHSIEGLAGRVSLSPSRFSHLFKEQTGDSVMETLLKLRLKRAARLLRHTSMLVSEIAGEVGFQSPFYFTKQFTAIYGTSPTEYRKKMNESEPGK
ncbi:helix-turn-helix domain-containing protein [Paenibacillus sp. LHD-117]|uniref:helix-turn-helix domain-containing protein n=1 Tax=Paenibacillus sp. LHD-117 TaxID=3071412 RepID=UPI0027DF9605|nr:helix-turn-helix domain-containing protein [Paenibacillus sp. LHD-117]MDQ6420629.1 helix-turn-helix domain-containing protein [Paenibacillus sp. LHD-117]